MFSLALGPRYTLARTDLEVSERREPVGGEAQIFPPDVAILLCKSSRGEFELAMTDSAVTGFLSWLEAAPPGAAFSLTAEYSQRRKRLPPTGDVNIPLAGVVGDTARP
ncbi:hypothetical protein GCM10029992_22480 [Glycomyces albus]